MNTTHLRIVGLPSVMLAAVIGLPAGASGAAAMPSTAAPAPVAINTHTTKSAVSHVNGTAFAVVDYCNVNIDGTSSELTVRGPSGVRYQVTGTARITTTSNSDVRLGPHTITSGPISTGATGNGFHLTAEAIGGYGNATTAAARGTLTVTSPAHHFTMSYSEYANQSDCRIDTAFAPRSVSG